MEKIKPKARDGKAAGAGAAPSPAAPSPASKVRAAAGKAAGGPPDWRQVWQLPALIGAGLLLLGGVVLAVATAPKPDYDGMLAHAEELIQGEKYVDSIAFLNDRVRPYVDKAGLSPELAREFFVLRARAIYLGQKAARINLPVNNAAVADDYTEAEARHAELEPADASYFADTLISQEKYDRALQRARALPQSERQRRGAILRRLVEIRLRAPKPEFEKTMSILAEFTDDPGLDATGRAWALARQSELLVMQGYSGDAISKLVRTIPRLMEADKAQLGDLFAILGKAYFENDAFGEAEKQLTRALGLLDDGDPSRALVGVMLARIEEQTDPEAARTRLKAIIEDFRTRAERLPAILHLAELEAMDKREDEALEDYRTLVEAMGAGEKHPDVTPAAVGRSLMGRWSEAFAGGDSAAAMKFASLAEQVFGESDSPDAAPVALALAQTHRRLADEVVGPTPEWQDRARVVAALDPSRRQEVRAHYARAAEYFKRHADRVVLTDNEAWKDSTWRSADSFDLSGDQQSAIAGFLTYENGVEIDPRRAEVRFRLGRAYQARGDYEMAARFLEMLVKPGPNDPDPGAFADRAAVPLAQVYLADGRPETDEEAERLLLSVVEGQRGEPGTDDYRDALLELSGSYYRRGNFAGAISRLEDAIERYPKDQRIDSTRYMLADAYRRDARDIGVKLAGPMADEARKALEETRSDRLRKAGALFDGVRAALGARDPRRLGDLERLQLRNSYLYSADCAFDLAGIASAGAGSDPVRRRAADDQYDAAIRKYDAAKDRYPGDPASLHAMMQIVNIYVERKDYRLAATANERARRFYESLPDSVWGDPDLPIGRAEWQRWLDSITALMPRDAAAPGEARSAAADEK